MAESSDIPTLVRLSLWVPEARMDDFGEVFERQLMPLLKEHGLVDPAPDGRPAVEGVFRRTFEIEHAAGIAVKARVLAKDAAWQTALRRLKTCLAPAAFGECLHHQLEPYASPAGPGRVAPVGTGFRRGLWQTFGILDGMPSCISALLQDKRGDIWMGTGWLKEGREWGACRYDGAQLLRLTIADGLANDRVRAVVEDRAGRLWFGTYGGISCYDGATFENYTTADGLASNQVWSLMEDKAGRLWIGSLGGLNCWDGRRFETYTHEHGLAVTGYTADGQALASVRDRAASSSAPARPCARSRSCSPGLRPPT